MIRPAPTLAALFLGTTDRQRMRVSQSLLGMPALLLMQGLLAAQWRLGQVEGETLAWFVGLTLAGCAVFYVLVRWGLGERLSSEPSLSTPQMMFAMVCVCWAYALSGSMRAALLCLMPLILSFGIFALKPSMARGLSYFGIVMLGAVIGWLVWRDPVLHEPMLETAHWLFASVSMAMIHVLAGRLSRMRARLSEQKAELSEALERIRLLATRDALTGLLNRRAAHDELKHAVALALRGGRPLVVALADLDRFKQINDNFGHQVGDRVLQTFARVAERELRGADRVARWGGEEFLFLLPDTDEEQAVTCLDRLRTAFMAEVVDGVPPEHALNFSAGVALFLSSEHLDATIERADRAMYGAKLEGRGRTNQATSEVALKVAKIAA